MKNIKSIFENIYNNYDFKIVFSALMVAFNWVFGVDKTALISVLGLIFMDTLMGVMVACKRGELSSYGFYRFAAKFIVYCILLATTSLVDKALPSIAFKFWIFDVSLTTYGVMASFLAVTEGISVFENAGALGFPVPKKLYKYLKSYNESLKDEDTK
jgi:toxin secretion/phage lysis holin